MQPSQNFLYLHVYTYFFGKKPLPTYEELLKLEDYRKSVVRKSYHSGLLMLMAWHPTILKYVFSDLQFWLSLGVYAYMRYYITPHANIIVPSSGISAIGSLMSILLVYYLNSGFSRYYQIYYTSMSVQGRIFDFAIMSRSYLSTEKSMILWRYLNAAQILGYMSFSRIHNEDNFFKPLNDKHNFLTDMEFDILKNAYDLRSSGSAYREVIEWATEEIEEEVENNRLSEYRAYKLQDQILQLRAKLAGLVDFKQLPVPFIYVHYIHIMTALYLPLFAFLIAFGFGQDNRIEFIGFFVVILNSTFVLGIRDICNKLQDPFGIHPVHFNVIHFVNVAIVGSYNLIFLRKQHFDRHCIEDSSRMTDRGSTFSLLGGGLDRSNNNTPVGMDRSNNNTPEIFNNVNTNDAMDRPSSITPSTSFCSNKVTHSKSMTSF